MLFGDTAVVHTVNYMGHKGQNIRFHSVNYKGHKGKQNIRFHSVNYKGHKGQNIRKQSMWVSSQLHTVR